MGDLPDSLAPLALIKQPAAFNHPDWLFEVKHDGYRAVAFVDGGCRLVSRNDHQYARFQDLAQHLSVLDRQVVLDGELVCLDDQGRTLFYDLMFNRKPVLFYAFDILWLEGEDLRALPLETRKDLLKSVVAESGLDRLLYVDHVPEKGKALYEAICERDMEGIVAKPKESPYRLINGKTTWIKIKNPDYSQAVGREELFNQRK